MSNKEEDRQLSGEQRFNLWMMVVDRVASLLMFGIKAAIAISGLLALGNIIQAFAGKQTNANVTFNVEAEGNLFVRFFSGIDQTCKWAWISALIFLMYGLFERKLRRRKTNYLQGRIIKLEKQIDPNRESSQLTPRGETHPEDKL